VQIQDLYVYGVSTVGEADMMCWNGEPIGNAWCCGDGHSAVKQLADW
jgi:hypothetical protein